MLVKTNSESALVSYYVYVRALHFQIASLLHECYYTLCYCVSLVYVIFSKRWKYFLKTKPNHNLLACTHYLSIKPVLTFFSTGSSAFQMQLIPNFKLKVLICFC